MFATNYNNDPTHQQVSGATMAAPPGNVKPWNAIKAFEELGRGNSMYGMFIRFGQLRSGLDPGSSLKVRKVFQTRLDEKKSKLAGGYMNSFPFCVRRTADGDLQDLGGDECFDVFDGNHRYHAIKKLIEEGSKIYSDDSRIPSLVKKTIIIERTPLYIIVFHPFNGFTITIHYKPHYNGRKPLHLMVVRQ